MPVDLKTYKLLRENKKNIIRNFHYRNALEKYNEGKQYENFKGQREDEEFFVYVNKNSKNTLDNIKIYKKIVVMFNKVFDESSTIDTLVCYTPEYRYKLDKMGSKKRELLLKSYERIFNMVTPRNLDEDFDNLLKTMAKNDTHTCDDALPKLKVKITDLEKKIKDRKMFIGKNTDYEEIWYFSIYDELVFYFTPVSRKQEIEICINYKINTQKEYKKIIEFITEDYSPIRDSLEDDKNMPEETFSNAPLSRRKSITELASIQYKNEDERVGKLGKFTPDQYFNNPARIENKIKEIMKCFRNDRQTTPNAKGKFPMIYNQSDANEMRETFMKHVLNFPPTFTQGINGREVICDVDLDLVKKIRKELNNVLVMIKQKYPPPPDKKYFLIDLAGGAGKHFDYSLYAFNEEQLKKQQDTFLVKENLWKKLEFKSDGKARNIKQLPQYLSKASLTLFDTANKTFAKLFEQKARDVGRNKGWLRKALTGEYFAKGIENTLKGQKNKIYIIWNVPDAKIYLDEFLEEELKVRRVDGVPQIVLDEKLFEEGKIRVRIQTENGKNSHQITYTKKKVKGIDNYSFVFKFLRNSSVYGTVGEDDNSDSDMAIDEETDSDMDMDIDDEGEDMYVDDETDLTDGFGRLNI